MHEHIPIPVPTPAPPADADPLPLLDHVAAFASPHPIVTTVICAIALAILVLAFLTVRALLRRVGRAFRATGRVVRRWTADRPSEDVLTIVAASIGTGVSAQGMWRFSGDVLGFDGPLRLLLFAFIEVAVITSAVRARRSMRQKYSAGIDGIAVWALTCLSAVLSSMDARSLAETVFRLAAPLVAAWLWERGMAIERRRITGRSRIHWRLTPERILVRLGLAEATDRTAGEVDKQRRVTRVVLAAGRARELRAAGAPEKKQRKALQRMRRAIAAATEYAGLGRDAAVQEAVLSETAAYYSGDQLIDIEPASAWAPAPQPPAQPEEEGPEGFGALAEATRRLNESLEARHDIRESLANLVMLAADATGQRLIPVTAGVTPFVTANEVTGPATELFGLPVAHRPAAPADVTPAVTSHVTPAPVTDQVTGSVTDPADPGPTDRSREATVVTPAVTQSVTDPVTPGEVTFDVTNPDVFDLELLLSASSAVTPFVTPNVTSSTVTNPVTKEAEEAIKAKLMRDFWDSERAQGRFPRPVDLARHADGDPGHASRLRSAWVEELKGWEKRRARLRKKASA